MPKFTVKIKNTAIVETTVIVEAQDKMSAYQVAETLGQGFLVAGVTTTQGDKVEIEDKLLWKYQTLKGDNEILEIEEIVN